MDPKSILFKILGFPIISRTLAAPLPDLSEEEFWDRNFVQVRNRPAKRLGIEFKTYIDFHRSEFPKGKILQDQDIIKALNLTEKEQVRLPLIYQYLKSRKVVDKTKDGKFKLI